MADSGVFRRSRAEARVFYTLATALCLSGVLARLWPAATLFGLMVCAAVVAVLAVLLRKSARPTRAGSFPAGPSSGASCFQHPGSWVEQHQDLDGSGRSRGTSADESRSAA